jgi:hypothetical protein
MAGEKEFVIKDRLPAAPPHYDQHNEQQLRRILELSRFSPGSGGGEGTLNFLVGGCGAMSAGFKGAVRFQFGAVLLSNTVLADQTGSCVVDVRKVDYATYNMPTRPNAGDTICASTPPTLSSAVKSEDLSLVGWTTTIGNGDILTFHVISSATVQRVTVALKYRRTG